MKKLLAVVLLLMGVASVSTAGELVLNSSSVVNRVLAATQNIDLDLNQARADNLSIQVVWSSAAAAAVTFTDGSTSTGSIRVNELTSLNTAYATNRITVASNTALTNSWLAVNAGGITYLLREGIDYTVGASSQATALSIRNRLNIVFAGIFNSTTNGVGVIYSTAANYGSAGNAYTIASSTPAALLCNSATFTGGQDAAYIKIANYVLRANTDWFIGASTTATATNIKNAISTSPLKYVIAASTQASTVISTSIVVGKWTNFPMYSSTPTALVLSGDNMTGGVDSDIIYSAYQDRRPEVLAATGFGAPTASTAPLSSIQKVTSSWGTGTALLLSKTAGTYPSPLVDKTTYYATAITGTGFKLSDTSTGSLAGVTLTFATSTLTGAGSFTLSPIAITGTPSFKLQKSNDGTNFSEIYFSTITNGTSPYQASQSASTSSGSVLWEFSQIAFRYLRLVYTNGTWGGLNINEVVNGTKN